MFEVELEQRNCFTPTGSAFQRVRSALGVVGVALFGQAKHCAAGLLSQDHGYPSWFVLTPFKDKTLRSTRFDDCARNLHRIAIRSPVFPSPDEGAAGLGVKRAIVREERVPHVSGRNGVEHFLGRPLNERRLLDRLLELFSQCGQSRVTVSRMTKRVRRLFVRRSIPP